MAAHDYKAHNWSDGKVDIEGNADLVARVKMIVDGKKTNHSKISVMGLGKDSTKNGYRANQVYLAGGLNGIGIWSDYLEDLSSVFKALEEDFKDEVENVVLANIEMDAIDDMFYPVVNIVWSYEEEE